MRLIFRVSHTEHMLRSVGDVPGIVGAGSPLGPPAIFVDPSWTPSRALVERADRYRKAGGTGAIAESRVFTHPDQFAGHILELDDAIDACEGPVELHALMAIVASMIAPTAAMGAPLYAFEAIAETVTFAIEARDKITARFRAGF